MFKSEPRFEKGFPTLVKLASIGPGLDFQRYLLYQRGSEKHAQSSETFSVYVLEILGQHIAHNPENDYNG